MNTREAEGTPTPWRISPISEPGRFWIEGPAGSGASEPLLHDRRIVSECRIYGDADLDAEAEANARIIVAPFRARWA